MIDLGHQDAKSRRSTKENVVPGALGLCGKTLRRRKGKPLQVHHKSALLTCAEIVDAELFTIVFPVFELPLRIGAVEHQQLTVDRFLQLIEVKFGIVGNDDHIGCDLCSRIVSV